DLDDNDTEHYKFINIEQSFESAQYEVFGSIISKNELKLEDFFVDFGLYDFNGFYATISKLVETNVNIKECCILWMVIGNPSKLSVFSPNNRDFQVKCLKKSLMLNPSKLNHRIIIPSLSHESVISFVAHSTNFELKNVIKLT